MDISGNLKKHNFVVPVVDTDAVTVCKHDGSEFSRDEIDKLTEEINSLTEALIEWEFEFYIPKIIIVKSKNYILDYGGGKVKVKGSSIRDQKKEPALREMMDTLIKAMLEDRNHDLVDIYNSYVKEALNVKDIRRWCSKKTVTQAILDCKDWKQSDIDEKKLRKNETDVWDAVKVISPQAGDKVYLYPVILGNRVTPGGTSAKTGKQLKDKTKVLTGLKLDTEWSDDHDVMKLVKRCQDTVKIFKLILDMGQFIDYTKSANIKLLEALKNEVVQSSTPSSA